MNLRQQCVKKRFVKTFLSTNRMQIVFRIVLFSLLETVLETVSQFIVPMKLSNNISHGSNRIIIRNSD